ncbi:MAG: type IV pilus modification PilV family protein [Steroidobacteraceae bacterium]
MIRSERGAALLEVIVALTILAVAGSSAAALVAGSVRAASRARQADVEMRRASALLEAVALWTRADLDRHLGERRQGAWVMRVDRPWTALYVVTLTDSATGRELLGTSLYRPEAPRAAP